MRSIRLRILYVYVAVDMQSHKRRLSYCSTPAAPDVDPAPMAASEPVILDTIPTVSTESPILIYSPSIYSPARPVTLTNLVDEDTAYVDPDAPRLG